MMASTKKIAGALVALAMPAWANVTLLDEWQPIASTQSGIKLDVDVVNVERQGTVRRAWVRALLDQAQPHAKSGKYVGAILVHQRVDCGGNNVMVERVLFLSPDGERLDEVRSAARTAQPIKAGSSDEAVAQLVCG